MTSSPELLSPVSQISRGSGLSFDQLCGCAGEIRTDYELSIIESGRIIGAILARLALEGSETDTEGVGEPNGGDLCVSVEALQNLLRHMRLEGVIFIGAADDLENGPARCAASGNDVWSFRKAKRLTQTGLGELVELSRWTISRIENGRMSKNCPSLDKISAFPLFQEWLSGRNGT